VAFSCTSLHTKRLGRLRRGPGVLPPSRLAAGALCHWRNRKREPPPPATSSTSPQSRLVVSEVEPCQVVLVHQPCGRAPVASYRSNDIIGSYRVPGSPGVRHIHRPAAQEYQPSADESAGDDQKPVGEGRKPAPDAEERVEGRLEPNRLPPQQEDQGHQKSQVTCYEIRPITHESVPLTSYYVPSVV